MAIDTAAEKLAMTDWCQLWESGLPPAQGVGSFDQATKQQFLNDYPGVLWNPAPSGIFILDLNTRIFVFLCRLYNQNPATADLTTMISWYLDAQIGGDYDERFQKLIDDATP